MGDRLIRWWLELYRERQRLRRDYDLTMVKALRILWRHYAGGRRG